MQAEKQVTWDSLDEGTREQLDARYMDELARWSHPGLTDEGVEAYLAYRRERPHAAVTTYEEGQVRKILQRYEVPVDRPDPVAQEEHLDSLEKIGAEKLHMTNSQTYVAIMVALTFVFLLCVVAVVIWL